jgi:hypothetical protein
MSSTMKIFLTLVVIAIATWYSTREHRRQLRNLKAWQLRITNLGRAVPSKAEMAAAKSDALYAEEYARRQAQKQ